MDKNENYISQEHGCMEHLEIRKPSIERIIVLAQECLEHDSSWWEFLSRCQEMLKQEDKMVRMLSNKEI